MSDPLCFRCSHPKSEHVELLTTQVHDGTFDPKTIWLCPNQTFLAEPEYRKTRNAPLARPSR